MTDIKKKEQGKKLKLHKETLKDMTAKDAGQVKGASGGLCQGDTAACPTVKPSARPNCR